MTQIEQFLAALKKALKARGVVYKDLAKSLGLSESSVKRILSSKSLSLERLEEICQSANLQFSEIVKLAEFQNDSESQFFSEEQEKIFAANTRLFHYYSLLEEGLSPQKILKGYDIPVEEAQKYLLQLDRLSLLELHPKDRVKMDRASMRRFRKEGPMGRILFEQTRNTYLQASFRESDELLRFSTHRISPAGVAKIKAKIEKLLSDLREDSQFENPEDASLDDYGVLMAVRPWKYSWMDSIHKRK